MRRTRELDRDEVAQAIGWRSLNRSGWRRETPWTATDGARFRLRVAIAEGWQDCPLPLRSGVEEDVSVAPIVRARKNVCSQRALPAEVQLLFAALRCLPDWDLKFCWVCSQKVAAHHPEKLFEHGILSRRKGKPFLGSIADTAIDALLEKQDKMSWCTACGQLLSDHTPASLAAHAMMARHHGVPETMQGL